MAYKITKKAYAKINLALDVTGRRADGYHLVNMIMQTVDIADTLTFERIEGATKRIELMTDKSASELSTDKDNLIYKAAKLLYDTYSITDSVRIRLTKNIPIAAGMAGGSTDAAATLHALNELFALGISDAVLMEQGLKIGADVPYCIMGGTAQAQGIGERLTKLTDAPQTALLVAKPDINVSTKYVYEHLDALPYSEYPHPDVEGMIRAIDAGDMEGPI